MKVDEPPQQMTDPVPVKLIEPQKQEEAKKERKVFKPASLRARERGTDPK